MRIPTVYSDHKVCPRPLFGIPVRLTSLQESIAFINKVTLLLSHITSLDILFAASPGDVPELRRRDELIQWVVSPLCWPVLSSFQRTQGHRGKTAVVMRGARVSAGSRSTRCVQASRRFTRGNIQLPGLFTARNSSQQFYQGQQMARRTTNDNLGSQQMVSVPFYVVDR